MKNRQQSVLALPVLEPRRLSKGFSLIELMVAIAIFMIIGGVAVSLVRRNEILFTSSQNQAGVNIALRNSIAQIQTDVVNAGSGYYPGSSMPFWPVGITATGALGNDAPCRASGVWAINCFDSLTVLTADPAIPAGQPSANPDGSGIFNVGSSTLYLTFNINQTPPLTAAQMTTLLTGLVPKYAPGTELLLVTSGVANPQILPLVVGSGGASVTPNNTIAVNVSTAATDNLGIMDTGDSSLFTTNAFGPAIAPKVPTDPPGPKDFVIRLDATKYSVNGLNQLVRLAPNAATADPIANNIVGFQVQEFANGAWGKMSVPTANWSQVRAVQITLVARTPSKSDPGSNFQNNYDTGAYQVQGISVVVNPRNLSMNN